jgi:predicted RND superfamily exporter protein
MSAFAKLAEVIKKHPWSVIAVCFLLTVGLGCGLFFLKGHVTYQSLLPSDFPSVKALDALREKFGGISYEYVLIRAPSVTDNQIVQFLVGLEDALKQEPQFNQGQLATRKNALGDEVPVIQDYVTPFAAVMQQEIAKRGIQLSLGDITNNAVKIFAGKDFKALIEQDYLSNPLAASQVVGRFITPDRKAALVMLKDGPDLTEKQQVQLGSDIEKYFKGRLSLIPGVEVSVSGDAILARDFNRHIKNKTVLLLLIALVFVIITLFIAFRRFSDTVLPVAVMLLGAVWTFGLTGWIGIEYSVAVIAVMPLILGTALTFVVPFVARYYEEAESSHRAVQAIGIALMAVGVGIFLAAITNVFGFLVFEFSVLPALRDFGLTCAIGTGCVFLLSVVLLPAVLVIRDRVFDRRAELGKSRRRDKFDGLSMSRRRGIVTRGIDRTLESFANLSIRRSTIVIIVFAVLMLVGLIQLRGLKTDSDLRKLVPRDLPGIKADFELEKYFGGQQQDVIMITGDVMSPESLRAMADLESSIAGRGGDGLYTRQGVTGLPDALAAANNGKLPETREEAQQALANAEDTSSGDS